MTKSVAIKIDQESIGLQIFNTYYAYRQSLNNQTYQSDISFSIVSEPQKDSFNILYTCMPNKIPKDIEQYDSIFIDNCGESLEVATSTIVELLNNYQNVYLLSGAYLDTNNPLYKSVIPYNHNLSLFKDAITRSFYPQYFSRNNSLLKNKNLCFINGQNKGWRNYFKELLENSQTDITIRNNLTDIPTKMLDCFFESTEDTNFREYINGCKHLIDHQHEISDNYYKNSIKIGIDNKFGKMPPGYFLMEEYYTHHCIIYPETTWINNQLFVTEKTWKCLVTGAIPWIVSGANCSQMINKMGFFTAWNLLPKEYQSYDNELNHKNRYKKLIQAIKWANDHTEIWTSDKAKQIRKMNYQNFFSTSKFDIETCNALNKIFNFV
jgi:hypothetical protein